MKVLVSRLAVCAGVVAALVAVSVIPVSAVAVPGPQLRVFNPNSGDTLPRGRYIFLGAAWDPTATTGTGVDRVQVFAGDRDLGSVWLGTAAKATCQSGNCPSIDGRDQGVGIQGSLGVLNPLAAPGSQFEKAGWSLKSRLVLKQTYSGTLWFYARSSVTGQETIVQVGPISIDPGRAVNQGVNP
jgi:hypothetical protein